MNYKDKPENYQMKFLNLNQDFKYIGGFGEKVISNKRVVDNNFSNILCAEDETLRKKIKTDHISVENDCINSICTLQKLRAQYDKKTMEEEKLIPIEEIREKVVDSDTKKDTNLTNSKPIGKMKGITKNNNN